MVNNFTVNYLKYSLRTLIILCNSILYFTAPAQDLIIFSDGEEVEAKVVEIGVGEISYKKYTNLDGPIIKVAKEDIFMIKYENGSKDVFESMLQSKSSENNVATSKVILRYGGNAFLTNPTIRVFWNVEIFGDLFEGEEIGRGTYNEGFEVEMNVPTGKYQVLLLQGKKNSGRRIWSGNIPVQETGVTYIATFKHNRFLGMMKLDDLTMESF
ncbi:MAG: hypothetical protein AAF806_13250 [Bacteroidota bacterium]